MMKTPDARCGPTLSLREPAPIDSVRHRMNASRLSPRCRQHRSSRPSSAAAPLFMQTLDSTVIAYPRVYPLIRARAMARTTDPPQPRHHVLPAEPSRSSSPISGWVAEPLWRTFGSFVRPSLSSRSARSFAASPRRSPKLVLAPRPTRFWRCDDGACRPPSSSCESSLSPASLTRWSYLTIPAVLGPGTRSTRRRLQSSPIAPGAGFSSSNVPIPRSSGCFLVTLYISRHQGRGNHSARSSRFSFLTGLGLAGLVFGFETIGRNMIPVSLVMTAMDDRRLVRWTLTCFHARRIDYPHRRSHADENFPPFATFRHRLAELARYGQLARCPFLLAMLLQLVFRPESVCLRNDYLHQRRRRP